MSESGKEPQRADALVGAYRALAAAGMNHGSSGNVSVRDTVAGMLITPTGATEHNLTAASLVSMTLEGEALSAGVPSSEWEMHAAVLKAFPDANAVVHTHADYCVAFSCLRETIPAFHYMIAGFGGDDVRCADYAPFGSHALSVAAVAALQGRRACLLANHGMLAIGRTLEQAVSLSIRLETLCRQFALARQLGTPRLLSSAEMDEVHQRYKHYGRASMPR